MGVFHARSEAKALWKKYIGEDKATDPESIVKKIGGRVIEEEFDDKDISGLLLMKGKIPLIFVKKDDAPVRKRFTICHELGHYWLHKPTEVHVDKNYFVAFRNFRSSSGEDLIEIEANGFAAELLMPEELLEKRMKEKKIQKGDPIPDVLIDELTAFFQVSGQAMTIRLTSLGYI
ncbi:MAG: ImmA/IrrE family metallo-endopeptidase [Deltaproteobacteria bacterium]|nr:ImmA/IrrE family metallo-endopeptidase [Deltaproteobacteria bacterium]